MVRRHLKRLNAPKSWPIERKSNKWLIRPTSGPHALGKCISLNLILKEILKYAKTTKEVKTILNEKGVLIDNVRRKEPKFPVGIMDVIEIPTTKEHFRVYYNKFGKFILHSITKEEAKLKPQRIIGKTVLKKGKLQLNLYDGNNIIVDKGDYSIGDTIIVDLTQNRKIVKHIKFAKGAMVYIFDGKYRGYFGVIDDIHKLFKKTNISVKSSHDKFETAKKYAFVIDDSLLIKDKK